MSASPVSRPWLRFLRFSVRGLIVLVLVIGVWLGWIVRQARVQGDAVAAINKAGGLALYDFDRRIQVSPWNKFSGWKKWIGKYIGIDYVGHVVFVQIVSDGDYADRQQALACLGDLGQLEGMNLAGNSVTDGVLAQVNGLNRLRFLMLQHTKISDTGLTHVRSLTNLQQLYITDAGIGDDGLIHFRRLTNLEDLWLVQTGVTDVGLENLKGMIRLRSLEVQRSRVTDAGADKLQRALPSLTIRH